MCQTIPGIYSLYSPSGPQGPIDPHGQDRRPGVSQFRVHPAATVSCGPFPLLGQASVPPGPAPREDGVQTLPPARTQMCEFEARSLAQADSRPLQSFPGCLQFLGGMLRESQPPRKKSGGPELQGRCSRNRQKPRVVGAPGGWHQMRAFREGFLEEGSCEEGARHSVKEPVFQAEGSA